MCVTECVCVREKDEVLRDWIRNRLRITDFLLHREKKQAPPC